MLKPLGVLIASGVVLSLPAPPAAAQTAEFFAQHRDVTARTGEPVTLLVQVRWDRRSEEFGESAARDLITTTLEEQGYEVTDLRGRTPRGGVGGILDLSLRREGVAFSHGRYQCQESTTVRSTGAPIGRDVRTVNVTRRRIQEEDMANVAQFVREEVEAMTSAVAARPGWHCHLV